MIKTNWISVKTGQTPAVRENSKEETGIQGVSERVLVMCKDGMHRFATHINFPYYKHWNVEGCAGQPDDFVTHYSELTFPEED